jgi:hypothetical protein
VAMRSHEPSQSVRAIAGVVFGGPRSGVDVWDRSASFDVGATSRRLSLAAT